MKSTSEKRGKTWRRRAMDFLRSTDVIGI